MLHAEVGNQYIESSSEKGQESHLGRKAPHSRHAQASVLHAFLTPLWSALPTSPAYTSIPAMGQS